MVQKVIELIPPLYNLHVAVSQHNSQHSFSVTLRIQTTARLQLHSYARQRYVCIVCLYYIAIHVFLGRGMQAWVSLFLFHLFIIFGLIDFYFQFFYLFLFIFRYILYYTSFDFYSCLTVWLRVLQFFLNSLVCICFTFFFFSVRHVDIVLYFFLGSFS